MPWEIKIYEDSLIGDLISVFNQQTRDDEFVVPLTPEIFIDQISSKPIFCPDGCFLAMENGKAIGFALTSPGADKKLGVADPKIGVVDGIFLPKERLEIGDGLLARCMDYFEQKGGVKTVYGFASFGGYPYWRGLYCGAEPVCLTHHAHVWTTFMARGFTHHQQSLNYLGITGPREYRDDLTYMESDLDVSSEWEKQSWKGHFPKAISAGKDSVSLGFVGYVKLPYLSEYRQKSVAGIYGMQVFPEHRRQGVASSLLNYLFNHASELGIEEILVGTRVGNTAARRTYEKAGMRPIAFRTGTMYQYE